MKSPRSIFKSSIGGDAVRERHGRSEGERRGRGRSEGEHRGRHEFGVFGPEHVLKLLCEYRLPRLQ